MKILKGDYLWKVEGKDQDVLFYVFSDLYSEEKFLKVLEDKKGWEKHEVEVTLLFHTSNLKTFEKL